MSEEIKKEKKELDLTTIISHAIRIPGVKVERELFLREQFKNESKEIKEKIVELGPVKAGISRETLKRKARRIAKERAAITTSVSFLAGIPGGYAMIGTIPADIVQFYGVALRMAQELVYLYGEQDIWCDGSPDPDKVTNQLILYCGVMLGATGAAQAVRVMSSALAKQALKKLPQKALTKTFYYPVVKSIMKWFGKAITKATFAQGVSKVIPIVGGVVSGGITLATILPMGKKLISTLDKVHFDYTEEDFNRDIKDISIVCAIESENATPSPKDTLGEIKKAKQMHEEGIISDGEYDEIIKKLISDL